MDTCEQCGTELVQSENSRRPKTRFCSKACNWKAHNAARGEARRQKRIGRKCEFCAQPLAEDAALNVVTCSRECSLKRLAKRAADRKKAARQAAMPPCEVCGSSIPPGTHAATRVCSESCQTERRRLYWKNRLSGRRRRQLFGVTPEHYAEMLAAQGNACAICRADKPGGIGTWHVDHCHETDVVRGLLCSDCNLGLGLFKDNTESMYAAIAYLQRSMQVDS